MNKLEKSTNISVLLACAVVVSSFARDYYLSWQPIRPALRKGQMIELSDAKSANNTGLSIRATLLLGLSIHCGYCKARVPFDQRLAMLKNAEAMKLRLVAVLLQDKAESERYLNLANKSLWPVFL